MVWGRLSKSEASDQDRAAADVSRGSCGEVESRGPRETIRIFWVVIIRASGESMASLSRIGRNSTDGL